MDKYITYNPKSAIPAQTVFSLRLLYLNKSKTDELLSLEFYKEIA